MEKNIKLKDRNLALKCSSKIKTLPTIKGLALKAKPRNPERPYTLATCLL